MAGGVRVVAVVVVAWWAMGCNGGMPPVDGTGGGTGMGGGSSGSCGGQTCSATERCDAATNACVADLAPAVNVVVPASTVTAASFDALGTASDDVAVTSVEWSLDEATWTAVTVTGGAFQFTVPLGLIDDTELKLAVRASDGKQTTTVTKTVRADRVGPQIAVLTPDAGAFLPAGPATLSVRVNEASALSSFTVNGTAVAGTSTSAPFQVVAQVPSGLDNSPVTFELNARDTAGNATSLAFTVNSDSVAPVVTIAAPAAQPLTGSSVMISGTVTDGSAVSFLDVTLGAQTARVTPANGQWTATLAAPAVEGPREVVVTATDAHQNVGTARATWTFDNVGPALTISSPAADALFASAFTVTVQEAATASPATQVTLQAGTAAPVMMVKSGSTWTATVAVTPGDHRALPLTVTGLDSAANVTTASVSVNVDTVAPVLNITAPATTVLTTTSSAVTVSVADLSPTVNVTGTLNGSALVGTLSNGVWTATATFGTLEGTRALSVTATDAAGNAATATRTLTIDNVPPSLSFELPAAGAIFRTDFAVAVLDDGTVSPPSNVTAQLGTGGLYTLVPEGAPRRYAANVNFSNALDYVSQVVTVRASDAAGNSTTLTRSVFIDNVAPVVSLTTPSAGQRFGISSLNPGTFTVPASWSATDGDSQLTTVLSQNGGAGVTVNGTSAPLATSITDNGAPYTMGLTVTDRAGNATQLDRSYTVDRVAPTVVSRFPLDNERNSGLTAFITFSEPVFGPTSSSDALTLTPASPGVGSWNVAHTAYNTPGGLLSRYTVYTAALASNLADTHGNPVTGGSSWSFHTEAALPSNGTIIATGVSHFKAASDADGVLTVGSVRQADGFLEIRRHDPLTGTFSAPTVSTLAVRSVTSNLSTYWVSADRTLTGLTATNRAAWFAELPPLIGPGGLTLARSFSGVSPATFGVPPINVPVVAHARLPWEPGPATTEFAGLSLQSPYNYTRGSNAAFATNTEWSTFASASNVFATASAGPISVRWTRVNSVENGLVIVGTDPRSLALTDGLVSGYNSPTRLSLALNPTGTCLALSYLNDNGATPGLLLQRTILGCTGPITCIGNGFQTPQAATTHALPQETRVAPFAGNGENTIIAAQRTATGVKLMKMNNAISCLNSFTDLPNGAVTGTVVSFEPVQLGNRSALLWLDQGGNLRLFVP